jgi:hypothetical protein
MKVLSPLNLFSKFFPSFTPLESPAACGGVKIIFLFNEINAPCEHSRYKSERSSNGVYGGWSNIAQNISVLQEIAIINLVGF